MSRALKVAANAVIGGTAEELGGGKFANGAITGAFSMLFNDLMHQEPPEKEKEKIDISFPLVIGGIDNTYQALMHYFHGKGIPMYLGNNTVRTLLSNDDFQINHKIIISGKASRLIGYFHVNLTKDIFHVGRTNIDYTITCKNGNCTVTYNLFVNDGFWDVDFIDERSYGRWGWSQFKPDGLGPNLERFGGTPYQYIPMKISTDFTNPGY